MLKINMKLFKRSNGYWYIRFERGKEKSLRTKDKKVAERLFKEIQREVLKGKIILLEKQEKIRLSEFIQEYLQWSETRKSRSTVYRDKWALTKFLEFIGNVPLRTINLKKIEDYFTFLKYQVHRKNTSLNVEYRHLKSAFNKAKDWGYIKENPFTRMKPFKEEKRPPAFLSKEEVALVLDYLKKSDKDFHDLVLFTLETGARRIEVLRLRWECIDWKNKKIKLYGKGDKIRIVPLSSRLEKILKTRKVKLYGRVFPYEHPDTISHKWKNIMKKLGLKYRFHDLRHTTASWLILQGISIRAVQDLLGHSDIRITQIYTHLNDKYLRDAVEQTFEITVNSQAEGSKILKFPAKS